LPLAALSLLALVTSLARPFGDFRRRKRGLDGRGLLKGGWDKTSGRSTVGTSWMSLG